MIPVYAEDDLTEPSENDVVLYLFHGDGCPHCAAEISYLDSIKSEYDHLKIVSYEVWYNDENAELLSQVLKAFQKTRSGVPTTVIGKSIIMGYNDSTGNKIKRALDYYSTGDYVDVVSKVQDGTFSSEDFVLEDDFTIQEETTDDDMTVDVPIVGSVNMKNVSLMSAAVIIGLIDGFNPCAMWVLLFLISVLLGMKDRKRMWILGLAFLLTSALVYLLIMLSWIQIAVKITSIIWIRNIIAVAALAGGGWNLRSFLTSNDSGCEVVDEKKRKSVFKKVKKFTKEKSFLLALLGVVGLAISVNLVELACSAGLPMVFSELLILNDTSEMMKFWYTVLYILFFLLDDLIIFLVAMISMKVTGISTKYNKYSHLLGGIIMIIVGALLLFKPEWLMFQFK